MNQERYEVSGNQFFLRDDELELSFEENFAGVYERTHEYLDGQVKTRYYEKEGKLHGPSIFFGQRGEILSESWFVNGVKQGKTRRYYSSGNLYSIERFKNGKPHLLQESFFEDGSCKGILPYRNGKLHGLVKLYWSNGQIKRCCEYTEGELIGEDRMLDEEGNVVHVEKALS